MRSHRKSLIIAGILVLAMFAIYLSGWSLLPFGKRYLPDYFFDNVTLGIKGYVQPNERLIFLNDSIFSPEEGKHALGVSHASTIVEYGRKKAVERFGDAGKYGAVEIKGKEAHIFYGDEGAERIDKKRALLFVHNTASIPSPLNLGLDAIHSSGKVEDTLFLGSLRYRLKGDTSLILNPNDMYYVNIDLKRKGEDRRLLIYRNGKLDTMLNGSIHIETSNEKGGRLYHYNEGIATYHRWAANTLVGIVDHRCLLSINGKYITEPISRVQTTGGVISYLNGIEAVRKYGLKGLYGAVEISGNSLRYFKSTE